MQFRLKLLAAALIFSAGLFMAQGAQAVEVAAGELDAALRGLAGESGIQILFDANELKGARTSGVHGAATPEDALKQLLQGTNYTFTASGAGSYVIKMISPPEKITEMAPIEVRGAPEKAYAVPNASTGTKTDTPLMETPLNVQVVTEQVLKDQQVTTLTDALNNVAGVVSSRSAQNAGEKIIMRGIANTAGFTVDGGDPGWSNMNLTVDGIRLQSAMGNTQMLNVERVEVLKGPSAVLYGHSEPGGMVNVVTKKPQEIAHYAIQQQLGSWGHSITSVDATGPIAGSETVFYRLIAAYDKSDDWRGANINNKLGLIAPSLLWKITPQTQMALDLKHDETKANIDPGQLAIWNNGPTLISRTQVLSDPTPLSEKNDSIRLSLDHEFNDAWKINAKWQNAKQHSFVNGMIWGELYSAVAGPAYGSVVGPWNAGRDWIIYGGDTTNDHLSADVTGKFTISGLKNTLLLGVEKEKTDITRQRGLAYNCSVVDAQNPMLPGPACAAPPVTDFSTQVEQSGFYLQDQVELPHNLFATMGARQQKFVSDKGQSTERTETHTTPRLGMLWHAQPWLSLYGNYSEGFGQGNGLVYPGTPAPPTGAKEYEVGVKTESEDGNLQATLAYFDLTKTNLPMSDKVNLPANTWVKPIGEVQSKGIELDVRGKVTPKLSMIFTYAYTDARITKNPDFAANGCCGQPGDRLSDVPANMASLWANYQIVGDTSQGWKVAGGVNWRDKTYAMFMGSCCSSPTFTSQQSFTPSNYLVNAMTSYAFKSGKTKWTAQLNINNLLNKEYWSSAGVYYNWTGTENYAVMSYGAPRSYMASLKAEF